MSTRITNFLIERKQILENALKELNDLRIDTPVGRNGRSSIEDLSENTTVLFEVAAESYLLEVLVDKLTTKIAQQEELDIYKGL